MSHIGDQLTRVWDETVVRLADELVRVGLWKQTASGYHTRYHQYDASHPGEGTTMGTLDNIQKDITEGAAYVKPWADRLGTYLDDITGVFGKADQLAAQVDRYTSEPMVEDVLNVLELVPQAREVLTPVLAGLKLLASGATTPAPAGPSISPAQPTVTAGVTAATTA